MTRQPMALANWKMEMTVAEGLAFLRRFQDRVGELLAHVQVILCPPYTALYPLARAMGDRSIGMGAQTVSAASGGSYTGEVSACLAADAGAGWVLLGHWEVRRHLGETDQSVNLKVHRALEAGLHPILLIGEESGISAGSAGQALGDQLARVLQHCAPAQIRDMAFIYEPEWAIGVDEPAPQEHVSAGCRFIRHWLARHSGPHAAGGARILYGGSVSPAYAQRLLTLPEVDGLGMGRMGRDPDALAETVCLIAQARPPSG